MNVRWVLAFWLGTVALGASAREWPSKVPSAEEKGKELYLRHCAACHGPKAAGDGKAAAALKGGVPNLAAGYGDKKVADLVKVVMQGRGLMPSFEAAFQKEDAEKVVQYLGKLGAKEDEPEEDAAEKPAKDDDAEADVGG